MDDEPGEQLPAKRSPEIRPAETRGGGLPVPPEPEHAEPGRPRRIAWRRYVKTVRGAVGLGLLAAALLLWPFTGFSVVPLLVGLGALIVLRLLRFDGLLRGWDVPLAGLVLVVGLMWTTTPWAWALAASVGVLIAGLLQLPAWRLAVVGLVLCVAAGTGYGVSTYRAQQEEVAAYGDVQHASKALQGASRPNGVLPIVLNRIARGVPEQICDNFLTDTAESAFVAASGAPDCAGAVRGLTARVTDPARYAQAQVVPVPAGDGFTVDACRLSWGPTPAGPQLGHLTIGPTARNTYVVTAFQPC